MSELFPYITHLKQNPLFDKCPEVILSKNLKGVEKVSFQKNDYIIKQSSPYNGVYFINKGVAKIIKGENENHSSIIRYVVPGELIGVSSYIFENNYTFSAIALEKTETLFMPADNFQQMVSSNSESALELMKILCYNIYLIENRTNGLFYKTTKQRVIELLISLCQINGRGQNPHTLSYNLDDIASLAGTTKNYLYKVINELSKSDILTLTKQSIRINNLQRLKFIGEHEN
ncbi:MAG: Crp/Fnr family transcriptional regulator [Flavobacteriales bacterium]|nr:Crp/Fnr family transcriptional regulator [Flavobacteriales bacterium]